jgi:hypothetical protein
MTALSLIALGRRFGIGEFLSLSLRRARLVTSIAAQMMSMASP